MVTRGPPEARFVVHPLAIPSLLAAAWCTGAALATHGAGIVAGALVVCAALCVTLHRGRAGPEVLALTAALAVLGGREHRIVEMPAGTLRIEGRVVRADAHPDGTRTVLQHHGWTLELWVEGARELLPGDAVRGLARASHPGVPGMPHTLRCTAEGLEVEPGPPSLGRLAARARSALAAALRAVVGGEAGELLVTLVLGERAAVPAELRDAHRATGLSHLLAVSGAHAAMIAWALGLMPGGRRMRPVRNRAWLATALLLLAAYGAVAGAEAPVVRAVCVCVLGAVAVREGRRLPAASGLAAPAVVTALWSPAELTSPGFVLSYAAVAGLACAAASGPPAPHGPRERWLLAPLRASAWALLATAPFTLLWFGQCAPWTVALTPLLAPLVTVLLLLGLATAVLGTLAPAVATIPALALPPLCATYAGAVQLADGLPFTPVLAHANPEPLLLAAGFAGALVVLLVRPTIRCAALAALCACVPHFLPARQPGPSFKLLAVGHGQCAVATLDCGATAVVDCGSMDHVLLPARHLAAQLRRRRIELLVVTHGDRDHTGSIPALLGLVRVQHAVLPLDLVDEPCGIALRAHGTAITVLAPGESCTPLEGVVVAAPSPLPAHDNDGSLWVRVAVGGIEVLLGGDAEARGIGAALHAGVASAADVLVAPHHGRPCVASTRLLDAVRPAALLVSSALADGATALGLEARSRGIGVHTTGLRGDLVLQPGQPPRIHGALADPVGISPGRGLRGR